MKIVCNVCEEVFEESKVTFEKGAIGNRKAEVANFTLIPFHPPKEGKPTTEVIDSKSGEVVETHCAGSLRPVKIRVQ
jgi:hypothetical protein